jgi:TPP-dependent pyruvate/acetoin dehydrogenase alpha subunit
MQPSPIAVEELNPQTLIHILRLMKLSRALEERARALYRSRAVPQAIVTARGGESVSVGATLALLHDDIIAPGRANVGVYLARDVAIDGIVMHWIATGQQQRDTTLPGDLRRHLILPGWSDASSSLSVALGAALAVRMRGENRAVTIFLAARDMRVGAFHEAIIYATMRRLPLLFVITSDGVPQIVPSGIYPYRMGHQVVDGSNVIDIYESVRNLREEIRIGHGPQVLETRSQALLAAGVNDDWRQHDPIARFTRYLLHSELATVEDLVQLDEKLAMQVETAFNDAQQHAPDMFSPDFAPADVAPMGPATIGITQVVSTLVGQLKRR